MVLRFITSTVSSYVMHDAETRRNTSKNRSSTRVSSFVHRCAAATGGTATWVDEPVQRHPSYESRVSFAPFANITCPPAKASRRVVKRSEGEDEDDEDDERAQYGGGVDSEASGSSKDRGESEEECGGEDAGLVAVCFVSKIPLERRRSAELRSKLDPREPVLGGIF